jgi:hypothetical protein
MTELLPVGLAMVFVAIAAIHVYWAAGGRWPGTDEESLVQTVMGGQPGTPMPGSAQCLGVVAVLLLAAVLVLGVGGLVSLPLPARALRWAAMLLGGVFALRGAGGLFEARFRPFIRGSRYARLNVRLYSPLCLLLSLGVWLLL